MQVCHGKAAPLRRVEPGDGVVYYSPTITFGSKVPYRAFTAVGLGEAGEPYRFVVQDGFQPWRRNVRWHPAGDVPAASVVGKLGFAAGRRSWAYGLRFGLMLIPPADFGVLFTAMQGSRAVASRIAEEATDRQRRSDQSG